MRTILPMLALLAIVASGCSSKPERLVVQHPTAQDLVCPAEPAALTDAQVEADADGLLDQAFNDAALLAGRACRDANARVCAWHVMRGLKLPPGYKCGFPPPGS